MLHVPVPVELTAVVIGALSGALHAVNRRPTWWARSRSPCRRAWAAASCATSSSASVRPPRCRIRMYLPVVALAALLAMLFAGWLARLKSVLAPVDALLLGLWALIGTEQANAHHLPVTSAVFVGTVTAVGGGALRDLLTNETPMVFLPGELYATAAFVGALAYPLSRCGPPACRPGPARLPPSEPHALCGFSPSAGTSGHRHQSTSRSGGTTPVAAPNDRANATPDWQRRRPTLHFAPVANPVSSNGSGLTAQRGAPLSAKEQLREAPSGAAEERRASGPLTTKELELTHAYWRACNYLSVGMIYLRDNPLLRRPLSVDHIKHRLLGHWGASPALSFVWVHLNRMIVKHDLDVVFVAGPGHGAPGVLGPDLPRRNLLGVLPGQDRRRRRDAEVLQAVLLPRRTSAATSRRRRPARSTRAASSATACRTPTAWRSTTPT